LFVHHILFRHLNSIHPAEPRLHRPEGETVKGMKLVREPRSDEQSVDSELGGVLLHCLLVMDDITTQDEFDRLAVIMYSMQPHKLSTKSVTSRPA
jgi:hypothetical protein